MPDDPVRIIRAIHRLERELDAATKLSDVRVISSQLQRARKALARLSQVREEHVPERPACRAQ